MKKRRGVLKEWHMDVPRNNSSLLLLIFFRANEALIRACKSFSVQHTCSNGDLNAKEGIIPLCIFRYDFVFFLFFLFFLSFSFFISKAKRIYQIHLWNCSRPKNVSPRIETLGLARHATIFSSFSLIIFYFDQREKCLIRRGTKKRTEERNPDEKVWQEFKNQPLCPVHDRLAPPFLSNFLSISFGSRLGNTRFFFISIPVARNQSLNESCRVEDSFGQIFSPGDCPRCFCAKHFNSWRFLHKMRLFSRLFGITFYVCRSIVWI